MTPRPLRPASLDVRGLSPLKVLPRGSFRRWASSPGRASGEDGRRVGIPAASCAHCSASSPYLPSVPGHKVPPSLSSVPSNLSLAGAPGSSLPKAQRNQWVRETSGGSLFKRHPSDRGFCPATHFLPCHFSSLPQGLSALCHTTSWLPPDVMVCVPPSAQGQRLCLFWSQVPSKHRTCPGTC